MDLLDDYRSAGPGHDEMLQAAGSARQAWAELANDARIGSGDSLTRAQGDVITLLEDQGVTADDAHWRLDPLPVLVEDETWTDLSRGLRQRAELLDQILTDLYGERTLLTSGILPPEIVLGHPGYQRAAFGIQLPGTHQLLHGATDLARNADGAWTVLADRTDLPLGLGYAMADRRVVSEVFAGPYRHSRTKRLGPFYRALRQTLNVVAPALAGEDPRVAILAPSTQTAAFDHGYLSMLLGVPMVSGADLEVSEGRVWVRSLGGRQPVDVLMRGVRSAQADPLDLDPDSAGTAGLLEAARSGMVSVVNPLGAGVLESPALATYLPRLARALRDEELLLPSVVTYWCGERSMCSHVIANISRLILRSIGDSRPPVLGWELSLHDRADLAAEIASRPALWVGQEPVEASTTPAVQDGRLVPRATSMRAFTVSHEGDYAVMSGALGHVAADGTPPQVTLAAHELPRSAKDVWVLAGGTLEEADGGEEQPRSLPGRDGAVSLRSAEGLYRMGRHLERAESACRLLLAVADRWDDFHARPGASPEDAGGRALDVLLEALQQLTARASLPDLVIDGSREGSIAWTIAQLTRDASGVRDNLTPDAWVALSSMERALHRERERRRGREGAGEVGLAPVVLSIQGGLLALHGIVGESLVRDVGWMLLDTGRRLERARRLVTLLSATVASGYSRAVSELILDSVVGACESGITFRRRYPAGGVDGALELLLRDQANPRSLAFQLIELRRRFADLPEVAGGPSAGVARDALLTEVEEVLAEMSENRGEELPWSERHTELTAALDSMGWRLARLHEEITRVHLARPVAARWPGGGKQT
ncbi:circularly permuted type 2 ATP-grasp protein [Bogoriella caseilytica]|uniref:Putative circularly permuted ATP-grasp superfamily protein n=1 Tax=Bogoriella caseilytica TaxID=56055 RepID=A0A3N2BBS1_9MICO|nr:circularly permuted type 2 ATP-grasp protein [Bogoriella caseilytica]ROR72690.1 putative circularly permuted ATP-grasp superfamily protein [Bogoriella caseilytica]